MKELVSSIGRGRPTHVIVAEALRRQIALGRLQPGDSLLSERELSQQLGIGRTTLRQAIKILVAEGWVDTKLGRGGGTVVLEDGLKSRDDLSHMFEQYKTTVEQTYEFRLALEPVAAGLAALRATEVQTRALFEIFGEPARTMNVYHSLDSKFHTKVAEASGNPLMLEAIENSRAEFFTWANVLWLNADWRGIRTKWGDPERASEEDHRPIAEAIANRAPERARLGMEQHLKTARELFEELLGRVFHKTA